nr:PEPxxWA-CTERM sorting domain-containing protein [Sandaracinobacteroides sayramensis]
MRFAQVGDIVVPGGVPEAATWALMIAGFGLVGVASRRRRALAA